MKCSCNETVYLDREAVLRILTDEIPTTHLTDEICVKVVPTALSGDQKQYRKGVCVDLLEHIASQPNLLESVVICDGT
ncbi:hypothetical protein TNCV_1385151 [Trichonephila clavipes]|nr:hypothetical protein TNCV_1385151 [Trichonephila clavipes]